MGDGSSVDIIAEEGIYVNEEIGEGVDEGFAVIGDGDSDGVRDTPDGSGDQVTAAC